VSDGRWINLTDPDQEELQAVVPQRLHSLALAALYRPERYNDEVFPNLENHESPETSKYLYGELAYPVFNAKTQDIGTVSIRVVINFNRMITVLRFPENVETDLSTSFAMPDLSELSESASALDSGSAMWLLLDRVSDEIHTFGLEAEARAEDLESLLHSGGVPPKDCRLQLAHLRNQFLQLVTIIRPTLSVTAGIIADELDLEEGDQELFTRDTEIRLISVRNRLQHSLNQANQWIENLRTMHDILNDYLNREQANASNRLTAMASIMLLPTFLVGLYGMNIDSEYFPEFGWLNGYLLAWILIVVITVVQVAVFRRKGWLSQRRPTGASREVAG
jgi:Mg2+ and Co2+ transporter CorA